MTDNPRYKKYSYKYQTITSDSLRNYGRVEFNPMSEKQKLRFEMQLSNIRW